jgi:hypothetical protein
VNSDVTTVSVTLDIWDVKSLFGLWSVAEFVAELADIGEVVE